MVGKRNGPTSATGPVAVLLQSTIDTLAPKRDRYRGNPDLLREDLSACFALLPEGSRARHDLIANLDRHVASVRSALFPTSSYANDDAIADAISCRAPDCGAIAVAPHSSSSCILGLSALMPDDVTRVINVISPPFPGNDSLRDLRSRLEHALSHVASVCVASIVRVALFDLHVLRPAWENNDADATACRFHIAHLLGVADLPFSLPGPEDDGLVLSELKYLLEVSRIRNLSNSQLERVSVLGQRRVARTSPLALLMIARIGVPLGEISTRSGLTEQDLVASGNTAAIDARIEELVAAMTGSPPPSDGNVFIHDNIGDRVDVVVDKVGDARIKGDHDADEDLRRTKKRRKRPSTVTA
ncbi:HRDC domain-containing protein [Plasmodiophora brassicae]|nr:hypothetical protein PBRA_008651 [Plasmodiophora brassicae]